MRSFGPMDYLKTCGAVGNRGVGGERAYR
jgi:hypothetical protein